MAKIVRFAMWAVVTLFLLMQTGDAKEGTLNSARKLGLKQVVFQTEVFALPVTIKSNAVYVDRRIDGVIVWYTKNTSEDKDMDDGRIQKLVQTMKKLYPNSKVWTKSYNGDSDRVNSRIEFTQTAGPAGDPQFFNAVERALNSLKIGRVQTKRT